MNKSFVCLTLLLAISLSACAKTTAPPPANQGAGTAAGGGGASTTAVDVQAVYKQNCISCHGNTLEGGVGPNLQKVGAKSSRTQLAATLNSGRGAMPSFKDKLSKDEINALATWLSEKK